MLEAPPAPKASVTFQSNWVLFLEKEPASS
jgi:hypothetical protein